MATTCLWSLVLPAQASALPALKPLALAKSALITKTERSALSADKNALSAMQLFVRNARAILCIYLVRTVPSAALTV